MTYLEQYGKATIVEIIEAIKSGKITEVKLDKKTSLLLANILSDYLEQYEDMN